MTLTRSTARVFSGLLSHLQVNDVMAAGLLSHTLRDRPHDTPIRISAEVIPTLGTLTEGPVALYGELQDGVLTVLGPDLRRRTLAAARPRGEMGPPAPRTFEGVVADLAFNTARATGKLYIRGSLTCPSEDGPVTLTFLVRSPLAETLGQDISDGPARLRGALVGDVLEVLGLEPITAKRELSRAQKDARNARARERRASKKTTVNG